MADQYTDQELNLLRTYYPKGGSYAVVEAMLAAGLAARDTRCIAVKAGKMGLKLDKVARNRSYTMRAKVIKAAQKEKPAIADHFDLVALVERAKLGPQFLPDELEIEPCIAWR